MAPLSTSPRPTSQAGKIPPACPPHRYARRTGAPCPAHRGRDPAQASRPASRLVWRGRAERAPGSEAPPLSLPLLLSPFCEGLTGEVGRPMAAFCPLGCEPRRGALRGQAAPPRRAGPSAGLCAHCPGPPGLGGPASFPRTRHMRRGPRPTFSWARRSLCPGRGAACAEAQGLPVRRARGPSDAPVRASSLAWPGARVLLRPPLLHSTLFSPGPCRCCSAFAGRPRHAGLLP